MSAYLSLDQMCGAIEQARKQKHARQRHCPSSLFLATTFECHCSSPPASNNELVLYSKSVVLCSRASFCLGLDLVEGVLKEWEFAGENFLLKSTATRTQAGPLTVRDQHPGSRLKQHSNFGLIQHSESSLI